MVARTRRSDKRNHWHTIAAACEPLERRALLSLAVAGPEFRVNTVTAGAQANAAVAADANGDFVVAWEGDDGSQGDFSYDGQVNLADFNLLASRFGGSVAAPGAPAGGVVEREGEGDDDDTDDEAHMTPRLEYLPQRTSRSTDGTR